MACVRCKVMPGMIGALVTSTGKLRGAVVSALRWASVMDEQVNPLQMFKNNECEAFEI